MAHDIPRVTMDNENILKIKAKKDKQEPIIQTVEAAKMMIVEDKAARRD